MGTKRLFSGVQPSGRPHIGNYFGALKQFVDLQESYEGIYSIVDLHALTSVRDPKELRDHIYNLAVDYLAIGIDPKKSIVFRQSEVPAHTELTWIFNCITTVPFLSRAHAYKAAQEKQEEVNVGLFDYPLLMASDILLYSPDVVPVGEDQRQHVEITRDTAEKFNHLYGETFKLPEPHILKSVGTIPGIDGQKMSKSYNNHIPLFSTDKELEKLVMSIVTDSKEPEEKKDPQNSTIFSLFELVATKAEIDEMRAGFTEGGLGYGEAKSRLLRALQGFVEPFRTKRGQLESQKDYILGVLEEGREKAQKIAGEKMEEVRKKVGLTL